MSFKLETWHSHTNNGYNGDVVIKALNMSVQGPLFLTRINFIPNMDA